jgi:hypothetical protein
MLPGRVPGLVIGCRAGVGFLLFLTLGGDDICCWSAKVVPESVSNAIVKVKNLLKCMFCLNDAGLMM